MSFSSHVKDDLARVETSRSCCRRAELTSFFLNCGSIRISANDQLSLVMTTAHAAAARKMFTLAREFMPERQMAVYRRSRLKKNQMFNLLILPQPALKPFLQAAGLLDEGDSLGVDWPSRLRGALLMNNCCKRAYLRGAFLAAGAISDPESSYHLEIAAPDQRQADLLAELLSGFGIKAKTVGRKEARIVYLKGAEQISDFMNIVGSHRSLLEFESVRVVKEVRNDVNRRRNCDLANINKTVAAAMRQKADIEYIFSVIGPGKLPRNLRDAAELRLEYPEETLAELSELSGLGRSALNHRLRRLSRIADNIRDFGADQWNRQEH